jgi:ATP-dependent Clp protease ATP-binding subunit ClpA
MGARPLSRVIQEKIKRPLAEEVLFGRLADGGIVTVDYDGSALTFEFAPPEKPSAREKTDPEIA